MIDVLMSAYNAEKTIEKAVNSVLRQTYEKFNFSTTVVPTQPMTFLVK